MESISHSPIPIEDNRPVDGMQINMDFILKCPFRWNFQGKRGGT